MFFCKFPYILYRDYPNFGYLTDNSNFGYDTASKSCIKVGNRILSKTGSIFYSVLTNKPQPLSAIAERLSFIFNKIPLLDIQNDAEEFFLELSKDGFINCCNNKDYIPIADYFSYDNMNSCQPIIVDEKEEYISFDKSWFTNYNLSCIHLDVSGLCNEHCIHCYIPDNFKNNKMSKDLFLKIIEQCKACNVLNITLSGGEPMLNSNLAFFIKECRENNFSINLLSNLTLLTDPLVKEFAKTPLLSIQTSLYSMVEEIHDSITNVKGSFLKTKRAIEILHKHNIPIQINCPIMKQNKDSYQDVLDWATSLNIEASYDYMLFGSFDGSCNNLQCRLEISDLKTIIKNEKQPHSLVAVSKKELDLESPICPVCTNRLCISHTGNIYPCEGWQSFILGNINDTTLAKIWEDSSGVQMLRNLTKKDFPKCRYCEDKDFCSICLIRNVNESNNLNYKDINPYFCSIAKIKRQLIRK